VCLHTIRDALVGMRNLCGVIREKLRIEPPTLINPRSKIYIAVQWHVCVYFFVCLLNKKIKKKKKSLAFLKVFLH
jgi:hypothetical protein